MNKTIIDDIIKQALQQNSVDDIIDQINDTINDNEIDKNWKANLKSVLRFLYIRANLYNRSLSLDDYLFFYKLLVLFKQKNYRVALAIRFDIYNFCSIILFTLLVFCIVKLSFYNIALLLMPYVIFRFFIKKKIQSKYFSVEKCISNNEEITVAIKEDFLYEIKSSYHNLKLEKDSDLVEFFLLPFILITYFVGINFTIKSR